MTKRKRTAFEFEAGTHGSPPRTRTPRTKSARAKGAIGSDRGPQKASSKSEHTGAKTCHSPSQITLLSASDVLALSSERNQEPVEMTNSLPPTAPCNAHDIGARSLDITELVSHPANSSRSLNPSSHHTGSTPTLLPSSRKRMRKSSSAELDFGKLKKDGENEMQLLFDITLLTHPTWRLGEQIAMLLEPGTTLEKGRAVEYKEEASQLFSLYEKTLQRCTCRHPSVQWQDILPLSLELLEKLKRREREFLTNFISCCNRHFDDLYPELQGIKRKTVERIWQFRYYTSHQSILQEISTTDEFIYERRHASTFRFQHPACRKLLWFKLFHRGQSRYLDHELMSALGKETICFLFSIIDEVFARRATGVSTQGDRVSRSTRVQSLQQFNDNVQDHLKAWDKISQQSTTHMQTAEDDFRNHLLSRTNWRQQRPSYKHIIELEMDITRRN